MICPNCGEVMRERARGRHSNPPHYSCPKCHTLVALGLTGASEMPVPDPTVKPVVVPARLAGDLARNAKAMIDQLHAAGLITLVMVAVKPDSEDATACIRFPSAVHPLQVAELLIPAVKALRGGKDGA